MSVQAEGGRRAFFGEGKHKFILTYGDNVKKVYHPFSTLPGWIEKILAIFRTHLLSNECPDVLSSRQNWRRKEALFWSVKKFPFAKFEIIPPFLCYLLEPLTNKSSMTWSSMINLWIDSRTCTTNPVITKGKV